LSLLTLPQSFLDLAALVILVFLLSYRDEARLQMISLRAFGRMA
jgi:hypothetical protein